MGNHLKIHLVLQKQALVRLCWKNKKCTALRRQGRKMLSPKIALSETGYWAPRDGIYLPYLLILKYTSQTEATVEDYGHVSR